MVIAELKVSDGVLIAPVFCTHLSDKKKKKETKNVEGKEYLNDSTSAIRRSSKTSQT